MPYQRKTRDVYRLFVDYGQGWEHELDEFSLREIRQRQKEYRENCPQCPLPAKIDRKKVKKTE